MYVFTPARLQDECVTCHSTFGVDFGPKKVGETVDVFGVSGSMESMYKTEATIRWIAIGVGIAMLALVWIIILVLVRKVIMRPLAVLEATTAQVAAGDLTAEVAIASYDEIGKIGESFNGMVGELGNALVQVKEATFAVASASAEISASIEEMASGTKEQMAHTATVAAAVEEMSHTIQKSAETAKESAHTADEARDAAEKGGAIVLQTIEGMKRIAGVVRKSAETVEQLGRSSQQIGEIVSVIDDIADQTNLLALNAAIEAARAGEHGRGFAVVADEVRKLADRTTKSTKEISGMIREIQMNTTNAVESMAEGTRQVDSGIVLADKAGDALRGIVKISQHLMGKVDQMAIASSEQTKVSEQIARDVESISSVTQETSLGSDQISHAADDLNRLADNLQSEVDDRRVDCGCSLRQWNPSWDDPEVDADQPLGRSGHRWSAHAL